MTTYEYENGKTRRTIQRSKKLRKNNKTIS